MTKAKKEIQVQTDDLVIQEVNKLPTKSSKIRFLTSEGWDRSKIAKFLNIRYQHVRNVQVTLLKKDM